MDIRQLSVGSLETNCYIVASGKDCVVVDPGGEAERILSEIAACGCEVTAVLLTHGHFDHFLAAAEVQRETGAPVWVGEDDLPLLRDLGWMAQFLPQGLALPSDVRALAEGDRVTVGDEELSVIHTPGHSQGSCCFLAPGILFSGDLIFQGAVGRTDLPGGDPVELDRSLARVADLPGDTVIYPGHGPVTKVAVEKERNPYLKMW